MNSFCSLKALQILLKLSDLRLVSLDRLHEITQCGECLLYLLSFSLERRERQHVGDMRVLIELETLVFLEQLGGSKGPPNHRRRVPLIQGKCTDSSNIIEDRLRENQNPLPCLLSSHTRR